MKFLIIDDSPDITDLLVKVLSAIGHQVSFTNNGREGLELINSEHYDAIFLDIAMPDFSGLDLINALIKEGKLRENLIVLFTASSITDEEVKELIEQGIHSCLRKPVQINTLFEKVNEIEKARISSSKKS
jgi:two-component system OmpR family response regulator